MRSLSLCVLLAAFPICTLAETYKCKQPDGKVSFQDQPCQAGSTGAQIVVRPTAPSVDPAEIQKKKAASTKDWELAVQRQRLDEATNARNQQIDAHNRQVRCDNARHTLGVLKSQRPVFRYDNKGERQYIEDSARQSEMAAAQRAVAENCN